MSVSTNDVPARPHRTPVERGINYFSDVALLLMLFVVPVFSLTPLRHTAAGEVLRTNLFTGGLPLRPEHAPPDTPFAPGRATTIVHLIPTDLVGALLALAAGAPMLGVMLFVSYQLSRFMRSVARGDAFTEANTARLLRMTWALFPTWQLTVIANAFVERARYSRAGLGHLVATPIGLDVLLWPAAAGAVLAALAVSFRAGRNLREDVEATI